MNVLVVSYGPLMQLAEISQGRSPYERQQAYMTGCSQAERRSTAGRRQAETPPHDVRFNIEWPLLTLFGA